MRGERRRCRAATAAALWLLAGPAVADLPDTVAQVRPSVVAVGTYQKTRRPPAEFRGTGFVVADGHHVATNAHVIPRELDDAHRERLAVFAGHGREAQVRGAREVARDDDHDVVVLAIDGPALPALPLGDSGGVREGEAIAFTGFPIGTVLGLYPVTHTGIVSALTPIAIPAASDRALTPARVQALRHPWPVFQLDATAYPGNSGSPVYRVDSPRVVAIVNMVFVKGRKENVLRDPSAIAYAIPVVHLERLLRALRTAAPDRNLQSP